MSQVIENRVVEDPATIVKSEYEAATTAYKPISRRQLALNLSMKTGMPYKDAFAVVDTYCDAERIAIPSYLSKEFSIYWWKALAAFDVLVALGFCYWARNKHLAHEYPWGVWIVATLFAGLAVFLWVKSLEGEAAGRRG